MFRSDMVSIITPAYNAEEKIIKCIESVIAQTYTNWEMIIVNDGSNDNTAEIVKKYTLTSNKIKLLNQENKGVAEARNNALRSAKGRFIAFLDSDDLWRPTKLERQIEFMKKNNYSFTFTGYEMFSNEEGFKNKIINVPEVVNYNSYLKNTIIGNLTVMMDRELIGEVQVVHGDLEDVLTWMYYLKKGIIAYGLNENLAFYHVSSGSVSGNKIKNAIKYFEVLYVKQKIPFFKSLYYQINYLTNAIKKRI